MLRARLDGAGAALRNLLTDEVVGSDDLRAAADLAWQAAGLADTAGRVLGAANQALPAPDEPHLLLWQAATTLREHRGDGHVAALVAHGVPPIQAHLLKVAAGETDLTRLRVARPWRDEDWESGAAALRERGWVDASGALTAEGTRERERIEQLTDEAAAGPWRALGEERTATLARLLRPLTDAVVEVGHPAESSPIGLPLPSVTESENGRELSLPAFPHRSAEGGRWWRARHHRPVDGSAERQPYEGLVADAEGGGAVADGAPDLDLHLCRRTGCRASRWRTAGPAPWV